MFKISENRRAFELSIVFIINNNLFLSFLNLCPTETTLPAPSPKNSKSLSIIHRLAEQWGEEGGRPATALRISPFWDIFLRIQKKSIFFSIFARPQKKFLCTPLMRSDIAAYFARALSYCMYPLLKYLILLICRWIKVHRSLRSKFWSKMICISGPHPCCRAWYITWF